ncbi:MAG: sortase [Patescibacteria group bacterium]
MAHVYYKSPPLDPSVINRRLLLSRIFSRFSKLLPTIMITVGASLIISVGYPIVSFELGSGRNSQRSKVLSPVPQSAVSQAKGLLSPVDPMKPQVLANAPTVGNSSVDYSQVNNWFNFSQPQTLLSPSNTTHYTITIPKLRINEALVTIGGSDLDSSLIHYGGTANPGEVGNPVIFGHSILPQFYNPKNYRSIFSLIPTLKPGDEIIVGYDGITYKYVVYDYFEVLPEEIDILEQRYNQKDLTLVTCVPPGTYWRRGLVKARLVEL